MSFPRNMQVFLDQTQISNEQQNPRLNIQIVLVLKIKFQLPWEVWGDEHNNTEQMILFFLDWKVFVPQLGFLY